VRIYIIGYPYAAVPEPFGYDFYVHASF